ncbi:MAG TPA: PAS domain S-box protein [Rhizomicrobium sp.]|nr:PAS domain S-box protein [Rhizomicrobium sp.]
MHDSERAADKDARALHTLVKVGREIAAELDLERAVQIVTDAATDLTGAAFGAFFYNVINDSGESYMLYALSGVPKEAFAAFPMPRNTKVFAPTFAGEGIVRSDDIQKDSRYGHSGPHYGQPKGHLPVRSYLAVPVTSRSGEVIGGLFFGHPEPGRFTAEHEFLVSGIAPYAATAIDNARLYRSAQREIARRKEVEDKLRASEDALRRENVALTTNATQREARTEAALAQLRDSERHFRLLVQSVTDYAIYMLDPTGTVVSWNAGAERIKGYRPAEIIGSNFANFFTPEDRTANVPNIALKGAFETGRFESEGWRVRKDGSRFWALAVIDAVRDEEGRLIGFAKITRDMTERREAQIRLERAQEQLAQSQKMEALGQLTGGVAHDFNNLLMIVSGQAQMMRKRASNPKDIRSIDAIEMAAKSGANLTRQLLTFARRQRLNPVAVNLDERVSALRDLLASAIGGAVSMSAEIPGDVWPVNVDEAELELALVNIAVNARDAMPNGGSLSLTAHNVSLEGSGPASLTGDFVAVTLSDTGVGIDAETLPKIIEPFFTTKEMGKGTGLGLSQVFGFARQSGGDLAITSEVGKGTQVTMYLPRARKGATPKAEPKEAKRLPKDKGTVLLVEDNAQVAEVSSMLLAEMGYEVLLADQPSAAMALLKERDDIRLVFSDIVMPGDSDGLAMAQEIRALYPHIALLLATGYSSAANRAETRFPILRKPYDFETLSAAVRDALAAVPA